MVSILLILLFPLLGFLINGGIALQQARGKGFIGKSFSSLVACLMPFLSFLFSLSIFFNFFNNPTLQQLLAPNLLEWMSVDHFLVNFGFVVDHLSSLMLLIVTGVGFLIHLYSTGYMKEDAAYARYLCYLNLFLFFMLILVLGDSLPVLFIGWEGVGMCSYLLIGFWFTDIEKAKAGKKAFVVNRVGDFAFLIGMFLIVGVLVSALKTSGADGAFPLLNFSYLAQNAETLKPFATMITMCLFFAATGKSAQIPLYVWLPDAMAGPTPVSALIHAATMVTAGIYMIARLHFLFVMAPLTLHVIATVGLATAFMAALIGLTQYDIKKVLAYSTVSQLGFMFLALGVGGFSAGIFHVMTHAFFKACLFLGAGSVIHSLHHEQDIRHMGGLRKYMPITMITFLISTLAISGFPPFSGFFSKDEILFLTYANAPCKAYYWIALLTAGITAFYMMRVFVYTFLGETRYHHPEKIHESPLVMTLPLIVLALLAAVGGLVGMPHILGEHLGMHNWFEDWLAFLGQQTPEHLEGPLQEGQLMGLSTVWAIFCSLSAFLIYTFKPGITKSLKTNLSFFYQLIAQKFKIDELYDLIIVKPIKWISEKFLYQTVDVKVVDGMMVHGVTGTASFFATFFSKLQNGQVSYYLFYMLLGVCLVLGMIVL